MDIELQQVLLAKFLGWCEKPSPQNARWNRLYNPQGTTVASWGVEDTTYAHFRWITSIPKGDDLVKQVEANLNHSQWEDYVIQLVGIEFDENDPLRMMKYVKQAKPDQCIDALCRALGLWKHEEIKSNG